MKVRALLAVAVMTSAVFLVPDAAEAQRRAVRRGTVVVAPAVVVRPRTTVFVGGYYYPSLYRASLYYGGYPRYYYSPAYYQWPPYYGYGYAHDLSGSVRMQVTPRQTEVFIDGYYAGTVDDFDGIFQRLHVEPGDHEIELYLPGHRPHTQRVYLQPGRTFRIRHVMEPLAPGDPEPTRPAGAPMPPAPRTPAPAGSRQPVQSRAPGGSTVQGFGQLALRVQPDDAEVLIDGEPWAGAADEERLVVELGAGVHRLEVRKDGFRSYFTDVTIRSGETRTLNVALTKQ